MITPGRASAGSPSQFSAAPPSDEVHQPGRRVDRATRRASPSPPTAAPRTSSSEIASATGARAGRAASSATARPRDELERHRGHGEDEGHAQRVPEPRIAGEEHDSCRAPRSARCRRSGCALEGEPQHPQRRIRGQRGQHHERGRDEEQALARAGVGAAPRRIGAASRRRRRADALTARAREEELEAVPRVGDAPRRRLHPDQRRRQLGLERRRQHRVVRRHRARAAGQRQLADLRQRREARAPAPGRGRAPSRVGLVAPLSVIARCARSPLRKRTSAPAAARMAGAARRPRDASRRSSPGPPPRRGGRGSARDADLAAHRGVRQLEQIRGVWPAPEEHARRPCRTRAACSPRPRRWSTPGERPLAIHSRMAESAAAARAGSGKDRGRPRRAARSRRPTSPRARSP